VGDRVVGEVIGLVWPVPSAVQSGRFAGAAGRRCAGRAAWAGAARAARWRV